MKYLVNLNYRLKQKKFQVLGFGFIQKAFGLQIGKGNG